MKNSTLLTLSIPLAAMLAAPKVEATPYTWTATATGTLDWTAAGNWDASTQYVSGASNELIFFSDSTTYIGSGTRTLTTNVPATLSMNTLTLNGRGASSGASQFNMNIGTNASTWTIGDGTTSVVNLNGNAGATTAANLYYNVAANLTLNQATTLFTGNGTAGVHTGLNDPGFVFSGGIGESAAGYGITKSGSSRLTLSGGSLTFTGDLTVNGGSLFLTGNSNPGFAMTVNSGAILRIGNNTATQLSSGNYAGNISTGTGGTLQLWSTSAQEYSGVISGAGGIHKAYAGTLTLSGNNTYTGKTQFIPQTASSFTVNVSSFDYISSGDWANHGLGSSLGAPTTVANGTIDLGSGSAQANVTLNYTGAGETTDRVLNISFNGTATQTISASGSGLLKFTSAPTVTVSSGSNNLVLTGTGSGEFTQAIPQLPAAGGISKQGSGTWTLGGANTYTASTKVTAGTLVLANALALQNSPIDTATSIAGTGSAGFKTTVTTLGLGGLTGNKNLADVFRTDATGGPGGTTALGGYSGVTALTLNTASGTSLSYSGSIAAGATGMTLTKTGPGIQYLNGTNSYTGLTTVSGGTLGSGTGFSGAVTASTGGILSPGASAGAFGTLAISEAGTSALTLNGGYAQMDVSTASNDLIAVTGNAVLNGTNTVVLNPTTGVSAGTYNLVTYAATTGSGLVVFANGSTTLGNATLAVNAGNIQMTVGAGDLNNSVWVGTTATWDSGTNWNRNGVAAQAYVDGDFVTIDDTGSNAAAITSAGTVSPAQLTFNNSAKDFVVTATIGGTGTPLVKMGTRTATLGSSTVFPANSYTGGTVVLGGILNLAGSSNSNVNYLLGDAAGGITLNGGQLRASSTNVSAARSVTVLAGGGSLYVNKNNNFTTTGKLSGSGTLTLLDPGGSGTLATYSFNSTANDFTGGLVLNNAILNVSRLDDSANNIVINSNTSSATGLVNSTPGLRYNSGAASPLTLASRAIEFNGAVTSAMVIQNNSTTHAITISTDLVATGAGAKTLMLDAAGGAGSPTNVFSGDITDGTGGGTVGVVKPSSTGAASNASTSTWELSGNNTYTGPTAINTGILSVNSIGSVGSGPSALGAPATVAAGTIAIGSSTATGTLKYTGGATTTDRVINLAGTTGGATLNQSGAGLLKFTSDLTATGVGTKTLTLTGSTDGIGELAGSIVNGSGTTAITKTGTGVWVLSGANTRTGITTISGGLLQFANQVSLYNNTPASWTKTNLIVNSGGTLGLHVGGTGEFTAGDVSTLLTNLRTSINNNGLRSGSAIAFDTTNAAGGVFTLADNIANSTGTGSGAIGLTKRGTNTLELTGTNTYSGTTTISAGTLRIGNGGTTGTLGSGPVVNDGNLAFSRSDTYTVAGGISGTGTLTQEGSGTTVLAGASSYLGTTTVSQGTLLITGSTASAGLINVSANAALGGGGAGGVATLAGGAELSPGSPDGDDSNHLSLTGLTLASQSVFRFEPGNPSAFYDTTPGFYSDHVTISGALTLDGKLLVANRPDASSFDLAGGIVGDIWLIMSYSTTPGDFTNNILEIDPASAPLPDGLVYRINTISNPGYIYLEVVVPEAGSAALLGLGALVLLLRRRGLRA